MGALRQQPPRCCLVFDAVRTVDRFADQVGALGDFHHGPVVYRDGDIAHDAQQVMMADIFEHGVSTALNRHARQHLQELFFTKLRDWESECEYRLALLAAVDEPIHVDYGKTLRAVIIGADVEHIPYMPSVEALCLRYNAEIFKISWTNGRPRLAPP